MPSLSGTFSADGQVSATLYLRSKESASFTLVNAFTGTVVLERSLGGQAWEIVRVFFAIVSGNIRNDSVENWTLRLRCVDLVDGVNTIDYTLADIDGDRLYQVTLKDGREILSVTDEGNLYVLGALFSGGGGNSFATIQTDTGTNIEAASSTDVLTITSSDDSLLVDGDGTTDTLDLTLNVDIDDLLPAQAGQSGEFLTTDGSNASWAAINLSAYAPLDSPTFTTKTTHSYSTASRVPYFNVSKELVSSSVTDTELGYVSGVTSAIQTQLAAKVAGAGTVVDNNFALFNGTGGASLKQFGLGMYTGYGTGDPALTATGSITMRINSIDRCYFTTGGVQVVGASNLTWATNGGGDIGANSGNRPRFIYADSGFVAKGDHYYQEAVGKSFVIAPGANAKIGTGATLVTGTVTVSTTAVTAKSHIIITKTAAGGTEGFITVTKTAATSFTLTSSSATDTSVFDWFIIERL